MANQFVTTDGTLIIPGAYAKTRVVTNPGALGTSGVLAIIGESDEGPDFTQEEKISANTFGPDQIADIAAKYGDGPIANGARAAASPSNDADITGSFQRILIVKTNSGEKAAGLLPAIGGGSWASIDARLAGKKGNLINRTVTQATAETLPTTGSIVLTPPQVSTDVAVRTNGGSEAVATLGAAALPSAMVSSINALAGVTATGGANRAILTGGEVGDSLTLTVDSGFQVHVVIDTAFAALPTVGDIAYIPTGSPFAVANEGSYVVTAVAAGRIDMFKLLNAAGTGSQLTAPSTEGPVVIAAATDFACFSPIVVTNDVGAVIPGQGKSLEVAESGSAFFGDVAFVFDGATASPPADNAEWVSKAADPQILVSATEYQVNVTVARQSDSVNQTLGGTNVGGKVVMAVGYDGTSGSMVIDGDTMTITVVGGSGVSPAEIDLKDYSTVNSLVEYINSLTGFVALAPDLAMGQKSPRNLDDGTYGIASTHGVPAGRVKQDGYALQTNINGESTLVTVAPISPATKLSGLPDVASLAFLSGGTRGATTNADIAAAFTALEGTRVNFVIPLFSRDASSDIADGFTDAASTYDIASINAQLLSHVLLMSQFKRRRRRQGFGSFRGTFAAGKQQAGNLASARVALFFQDIRDLDNTGTVRQMQPWALACKAAAMQAAGFYKGITNKFINCSGILQAAGDFDDQKDSNLEDALLAGLCPAGEDESGGFKFISDQTTYTLNDNFAYNSIQTMYAADLVAAGTEVAMDRAFVGKSTADVTKALALTTLDGIMANFMRLKLIAPDDQAPKGYMKPTVRIGDGAVRFSLIIKVATTLYWAIIDFEVQSVQSSG